MPLGRKDVARGGEIDSFTISKRPADDVTLSRPSLLSYTIPLLLCIYLYRASDFSTAALVWGLPRRRRRRDFYYGLDRAKTPLLIYIGPSLSYARRHRATLA